MQVESIAQVHGSPVLASLTDAAMAARSGGPAFDPLPVSTTLRRQGHTPEVIAAAITQAQLRARAVAKFGMPQATRMLFTSDGLEQATRPAIARRHADRFVDAGVSRVWDLGCGIGSDGLALQEAGLDVVAVDLDPLTAQIAAVNLGIPVRQLDVETLLDPASSPGDGPDLQRDGLWFDPARRTPGVADIRGRTRRTFGLADLAPSWELVQRNATAAVAAGAKLSPAFGSHQIPPGAEAQWTSYGGELLECTLWWGAAVRSPGRSAAVHTGSGWIDLHQDLLEKAEPRRPNSAGPQTVSKLDDLGPWLYEADSAVRSAGLLPLLTAITDGREVSAGSGWVSSAREVGAGPDLLGWARRFRLLDVFPFRPKTFRAWVRRQSLRELTIRTRGASVDAQALRRSVPLEGAGSAIVLITRVGGRQCVLHIDPVP